MKKISLILALFLLSLSFIGCATLVSEEVVEVQATIIKVDRDPARYMGKVYRPADYDIYFEYDGIKGSWDVNKQTYNAYKDKVGELIKCYLITYTYDDGTTQMVIKAIEDK